MIRVLKSILLFALLILLLPGCEPIYYDVPVENEPAFKSGEYFYFESSTGNRDTVVATFSKSYRDSDKRYHYENIGIQYDWINGSTIVEQIKLHYEISFSPILKGFDFIERIDSYSLSNGAIVHGVLLYRANVAEKQMREVYIHARYGIIEFTKPDGEVMIRVSE
jgi:hypothetical protein